MADGFNLETALVEAQEQEQRQKIMDCLESWETIRSMEIKVEYVVDRLIPKGSIIVLFGKGGIGKTWLVLDIGRCIGNGTPYLGLSTSKTPVIFIDFENPLAVLNTRTLKLGPGEGVSFWRANNPQLAAPRLDVDEWEQYKQLPLGAILIFDTLRASQRTRRTHGRLSLMWCAGKPSAPLPR